MGWAPSNGGAPTPTGMMADCLARQQRHDDGDGARFLSSQPLQRAVLEVVDFQAIKWFGEGGVAGETSGVFSRRGVGHHQMVEPVVG